MFEQNGTKLSYQGDKGDGYSVYYMMVDDRPVFEVQANKDEAGIPVYVRMVESPLGWIKTPHRAFAVEDGSRISAMSMKEAVYMNYLTITADLLVGPKN